MDREVTAMEDTVGDAANSWTGRIMVSFSLLLFASFEPTVHLKLSLNNYLTINHLRERGGAVQEFRFCGLSQS